ncbi:MAG: P-loop ATPase [Magnetospirillum sp.]|nr:MAG: P-loop ATPase [Magnetospirillum sp.]
MIDLNDVWLPPARFELGEIRERLAATAQSWLPGLFPQARLSPDRRTLRCADLSGRAPRKEGSCTIHLAGPHAGWGYDHATGEMAGPIDLIHHATGLADRALFEEAARLAQMDLPAPPRPPVPKPSHDLEVARILGGSVALAGTAGEAYLRHRGVGDPRSPDLLFHDDLADFEARRGWPGLVGMVRDGTGTATGGIHRTFLLEDGSDKAPPGKKMLGPVAGGSVRLAPVPADGHLGIAEGIETALSAWALFGVPTWAALSAGNLRDWQWPEGVTRVTIFADTGEAGQSAAADLKVRLESAGIAATIVSPLHGDDFNDDLRKGATASDYRPAAEVPAAPPGFDDLRAAALQLTFPPDMADLGRLLGELARTRLDAVAEREVLVAIKATARIPVSVTEKQLRDLRRRLGNGGGAPSVRPAWAAQLRVGADGNPERNEANVITALSHDEAFAGALFFDEFRQEIVIGRPLPWDEQTQVPEARCNKIAGEAGVPRPWSDGDDVRCAEWLQRREVNVAPAVVARSVGAVARDIRVHPVREYLKGLRWDGIPRLETWALTYLGAADTRLNRAFGSAWMISAVARIMRPGAKVDHMLILEGPQGAKKSTALKVLAGEEWFTDELAEIGSKDAAQQMRGVWIIEIAELDAIGRAEVSRIKSFLTRTNDRYRPPYERYVIDVPRQCVFAGSVNPDTYLRDETGNRRFWPIRCGQIDLGALRQDRDQLWAEAVTMYAQGAIWWLADPELIALAAAEQEQRYHSDAWDGLIDRWLSYEKRRVNYGYGAYDDWREEEVEREQPLTDVSVGDILQHAISIEPGRWTRGDQMRVTAYLKARSWQRYQARAGSREGNLREWRYSR